ncbi:hypothetical protein ACF1A5_04320 [Streptomyces sp. NPDC014864]|uniref:hypothetical protein n=1 Tax=Streptomyces sp. NPDC014864 TaxID=3364924 RepID=UPI0036FDC65F
MVLRFRDFLDFLARFRRVGTAGAAAVGVPADRAAERATEVRPLFALLAAAQEEADEIRRAGRRDADAVRREARERAEEIVTGALAGRAGARAAGFAAGRGAVAEEADRIRRDGGAAARALRRRAEDRMPALVARVVRDALRVPDDGGGPG